MERRKNSKFFISKIHTSIIFLLTIFESIDR